MNSLSSSSWGAQLSQVVPNYQKALIFGAWGAAGGAVAALLGEMIQPDFRGGSAAQLIFFTATLFSIIGGCIGLAIMIGYANYMKRGFQISESINGGALPGLIAGAVAGALAEFLFGALGRGDIVRVLCWGVAGSLLGLGLSYRIQNLGLWRGLGGGGVGGLVGGILFVTLGRLMQMGGSAGRLAGFAAIGFCIGIMLVIAEAMFREAWLEVRYGPKETRNVSLGIQPVSVGGDVNRCAVYARNTEGIAYRYKLDQGKITFEDVPRGQTTTILPGHSQTVGNLVVTVMAAGSSARVQVATPQPAAVLSKARFVMRLSTGKTVSLSNGITLSAADISGLQAVSGTTVAEVSTNPNDPSILGLKNLSRNPWTATLANRDQVQVAPGRNVRIASGTQISFGSVSAEIEIA